MPVAGSQIFIVPVQIEEERRCRKNSHVPGKNWRFDTGRCLRCRAGVPSLRPNCRLANQAVWSGCACLSQCPTRSNRTEIGHRQALPLAHPPHCMRWETCCRIGIGLPLASRSLLRRPGDRRTRRKSHDWYIDRCPMHRTANPSRRWLRLESYGCPYTHHCPWHRTEYPDLRIPLRRIRYRTDRHRRLTDRSKDPTPSRPVARPNGEPS